MNEKLVGAAVVWIITAIGIWMTFWAWLLRVRWTLISVEDTWLIMMMAISPSLVASISIVLVLRLHRRATLSSRIGALLACLVAGTFGWFVGWAATIKALLFLAIHTDTTERVNNSIQFLWAQEGLVLSVIIPIFLSSLLSLRRANGAIAT